MKPKNRGGSTMTEARYWGLIRSGLRKTFRYWPPLQAAKIANRTKHPIKSRQKFDYHCEDCSGVFAEKEIQVDHIEPLGSLKCLEDLIPFVEALSAETGFQILCKPCHQNKTNRERPKKSPAI